MDYHAALCISGLGGVVRVGASANKGRGLFSTRVFPRGQPLFTEVPLCALQHSRNVALVRACSHCLRVIGSVEDALSQLITVRASRELAAIVPEGAAAALAASFESSFPALPRGASLPLFASPADSIVAPVVPCAWGCGAEFCSEHCRADAARRYHLLVCPSFPASAGGGVGIGGGGATGGASGGTSGAEDGVNAAALFERQALATNEIFLLAAKLIGRVLETWARNGHRMDIAMHQLAALHSAPWPSLFEIRQDATEEKRKLLGLSHDSGDEEDDADDDDGDGHGHAHGVHAHGESDSDEMADGDDVAGHGDVSEAERAREWCADSLVILRALVRARLPAFVEHIAATSGGAPPTRVALNAAEEAQLFAPDVYERIVGAFELNNLEVKIDSPLRDYLTLVESRPDALAALSPVLAQACAARAARRSLTASIAAEGGAEVDELLDECDLESVDDDDDDVGGVMGGGAVAVGMDEEAAASDDEDPVIAFTAPNGRSARLPLAHIPVCDGTALFAIICTMNHSCAPNVQVQYDRGDSAGTLVALRDIADGEELFINYVDVEKDVDIRAQDLRHYGFTCGCDKCAAERAEKAGMS